jgi:hypothetical protein
VKGYWGSGGIAPHIFYLGTGWRWVVSFTPGPLFPQGKSPCYPLNRRLGGPQSRSGRGGEEKSSHSLSGLDPPIVQPVAQRYTAELSRLLFLSFVHRLKVKVKGNFGPVLFLNWAPRREDVYRLWSPLASCWVGTGGGIWQTNWDMKLTTQPPVMVVLRLRMRGAVPPTPYVFMVKVKGKVITALN